MTDDELFEERVRAVLIDFKIRRVSPEPDEARAFVGRIFSVPPDECARITREVLRRVPPPPPDTPQELPAAWQIELRRLGMAKTKRHQRTGDNEKVKYSRWCYAKALIRRLQREQKMSLTDIGLAVADSNAWAGSALDYNGMVAERHIARLEELVGVPKKGRAGRLPVEERLTREDVGRLAKVFYDLREKYGWNHDLIGNAVGIGSGQVSKIITRGQGGSRPVLDRALAVLKAVENGAVGPAAKQPPPEPQEPAGDAEAPEATEETREPENEAEASTEPAYVPPEAVEIPAPEVMLKADEPVAVLDEATKKLLEAADLMARMGKRLPGEFGTPWTEKASAIIELAETLQ